MALKGARSSVVVHVHGLGLSSDVIVDIEVSLLRHHWTSRSVPSETPSRQTTIAKLPRTLLTSCITITRRRIQVVVDGHRSRALAMPARGRNAWPQRVFHEGVVKWPGLRLSLV